MSVRPARSSAVRLSLRISAPVVLVTVLALGLTAYLNVGKFDRTLAEVEESRLRFTLNELRANLETGLDLGLPVSGLGNAQAALDAETGQDPDILSISVVDTGGQLVFNSGQARPAAAALPSGRTWLLREGDAITVGTRLVNNLGVDAGALVLRYSAAKREAMVSAVAARLALAVAAAVLLTTLCLVCGIDLLVRRMERTLAGMEAALDGDAGALRRGDAAALVEQLNQTTACARRDLDAARSALAAQAPQ